MAEQVAVVGDAVEHADLPQHASDGDAAHGSAHESARLQDAIFHRLLHVGSLRFETKMLLGAVIAQLIVAAVLVLERNANLPRIVSDNYADTTASISILIFVFCAIFSSVAWGLILAGAFRAGWAVRGSVLAIFLWAMWAERDALEGISPLAQGILIALIALVIGVGVATWFPERRGHHWDEPNTVPTGTWARVRRVLPVAMVAVVGGVYLTAWLGNKVAGQVDVFTDDFADQIYNIELFLIPVLVLAGSDFGDWADFSVARLARRVRNLVHAWGFAAIVIGASGLILWDGLRTAASDLGGGIQEELLLAGAVLLGAIILYVLAKPKDQWPRRLPFAVLAIVAGVDSLVAYITQRQLGEEDPLLDSKVSGVTATFWIVVAIAAIVTLVAFRKRLPGKFVAAGCFVAMIGLVDALTGLDDIGTVVHPFGLQ
jgi:hypothetical protein